MQVKGLKNKKMWYLFYFTGSYSFSMDTFKNPSVSRN